MTSKKQDKQPNYSPMVHVTLPEALLGPGRVPPESIFTRSIRRIPAVSRVQISPTYGECFVSFRAMGKEERGLHYRAKIKSTY